MSDGTKIDLAETEILRIGIFDGFSIDVVGLEDVIQGALNLDTKFRLQSDCVFFSFSRCIQIHVTLVGTFQINSIAFVEFWLPQSIMSSG